MLDRISKLIPLSSFVLLLTGYAYNQGYYQGFNIDILHYFEMKDFLATLLPTAITLCMLYSVLHLFLWKDNLKNIDSLIENHFSYQIRSRIGILMTVLLIIHWYVAYNNPYRGMSTVQGTLLALIYFYMSLVTFAISQQHQLKLEHRFSFMIVAIILSAFSYRMTNRHEVMLLGSKKHVSFRYKHNKIESSDSLIYVGQTSNNIFLYHKPNEVTEVLKIDDVDSLMFK